MGHATAAGMGEAEAEAGPLIGPIYTCSSAGTGARERSGWERRKGLVMAAITPHALICYLLLNE